MRTVELFLIASLGVAVGACRDVGAPPISPVLESSAPQKTVPGSYIVVLKPGGASARAVSAQITATHGALVRYVYTTALKGFSARLSPAAVDALRSNPNVLYVEEDQEVRADTTQTFSPFTNQDMWGLERVDQTGTFGLITWSYSWFHNGAGVYAYVVDSGLDSTHVDFTGRAKNVFDAFGGSGQDCAGHGTHVAGTIGSRTWGVAKGAYLRGVRVLDCNASGSVATAIAGLDWVAANHTNPAVVNASIEASFSQALNDAVEGLIQTGVFIAVAAGNSNLSACAFSPASAPNAVTVAAVERRSSAIGKADYSNWGSCVDIQAPGSFIRSTRLGGGSFANSGTSMAAPHVTGAAALYKSAFGDASQSVIAAWLVSNATTGVVVDNHVGTPNLFLFKAPGL